MSVRRLVTWILAGISLLLLVLLACGLAIQAGFLRHPLIALLAADTRRPIDVDGRFDARIFSRHPQVVAEHVRIGNPSWAAPGVTATIDRLTLDLAVPGLTGLLRVEGLTLEGATLSLVRDTAGKANWQLSTDESSDGLPLIRSLSMPAAHATLNDARRHLIFDGIVSVDNLVGADGAQELQIKGKGELNHVNIEFETQSDPLATANRRLPYHFSFSERSRSSSLSGRGSLERAFDFDHLQTSFTAAGANLKDLYALAGISLINTGDYHLSGKLERREALSTLRDLNVTSGMSDVTGTLAVDSSDNRPRLSGDLRSKVLRLADLGASAARHETPDPQSSPLLLSDTPISPDTVRHGDASVSFRVGRFDAGRVAVHDVAGTLQIEHGILTLSPLSGQVLDGQFRGRWQLNATNNDLADTLELDFRQLQIGELDHPASGGPRFDGLLNATVNIKGHGASLHQIGASANGKLTARLLSGTLRQSLAELSGLDIRGLGLMLSKSEQQTRIECGAANVEARDGTLSTDDLLIETGDVRITGTGNIQLDTEALHVELQGHPKKTRLLRVKAPLLLAGTLRHPHLGLEEPKALRLVDPGTSKSVDCPSLLAN